MAGKELSPREQERGIERREPQDPFSALQQRMNELFEDFWGRGATREGWTIPREFFPEIELRDTEKELKVIAELPGLEEKDIEVLAEEDGLTIRGDKRVESEEESEGVRRSERRYGHFERHIALRGSDYDIAHAKAEFDKGVLKIHLPKRPEAQAQRKRIPIK